MDEIDKRLSSKAGPPKLPPGIDSDETVLVSRRVVGGDDILFAWRDQPDDDDSGWVLLAGTEPDSYLENRGKFVSWTVGEVIDRDPSLALLLGSPPDSSYERESIEHEWEELEEEDDEADED